VLALVEARELVRKNKSWSESDRIREGIEKLGWKVSNTSEGPVVIRA
jgi:cysteinyl-tRNA synthetase